MESDLSNFEHKGISDLESKAKELVEMQNYRLDSIRYVPGGRNHHVFDLTLKDGESRIARFKRNNDITSDGLKRDHIYNSVLTLEREADLFSLVREKALLPAPKVYGFHNSRDYNFLILEKMPGKLWEKVIDENHGDIGLFLKSLEFLGNDVAKAQRIYFDNFGDIKMRRPLSYSYSN